MTDNLEKMTFAERVVRLAGMDDLPPKMNITELSDKSGIQYDRLRRLLKDRHEPHQDEIVSLADALNVSPLLLLTGRREQSMFTCDETGLFDSSVAMLQYQSKHDRYFFATKEIIDLLLRHPDVVMYLYQYLFGHIEEPDVQVVLQDGTRTTARIDYDSPVRGIYNRHAPEKLARLELLDELSYIRETVRPEPQARPKTARSAPSESSDNQQPV